MLGRFGGMVPAAGKFVVPVIATPAAIVATRNCL